MFPKSGQIKVSYFLAFVNNIKYKTSFDYQAAENFAIEKEYYDIRVRDVHYRNQQIKLLREEKNGVIHQIGFCIEKDFAVEVLKIPK